MLKTSVIICTRNRISDLLRMLVSLSKQTVSPGEIIVIDSSTVPVIDTMDFKALWNAGIFTCTLMYRHTRPGLTYQRNQGALLAQGEVIYFFDDDVILAVNYLEEMNKVFIEKPQYGGGMGTIFPLGCYRWWINLARALFLLQRNYTHGHFTASGMPTHAYGGVDFKDVEVLGGCCMSFRSEVLKKHTFDEALQFYGYMEDCDFSYRVSRSWPLFYNPRAVLEHCESPLNRDSIVDNKAMFIANYSYLFFKNFYPGRSSKLFAYAWSICGLFLEALFIVRDRRWIRGYAKGLYYAYKNKSQIPYVKI